MRPALLCLCALAACAPAEPRPAAVVLWHAYTGAEKDALEQIAAELGAQGTELSLVAVPYDAFPDKLGSAIPNGNGPDLFIFAHDRIGDWAAAKILEPIEFFADEGLAARFDDAALAAMVWDDSLWGLPLAVKSLALFYRTDLVDAPPATTDELLAFGRRTRGPVFAYESTKLYGHAAWLHGFGGAIFDEHGRLVVDSPEAVRALGFARELAAIVAPETTGALVGTLFQEGRVAMVLSGPWLVAGLPPGEPWKVAPLPVVSATGRPAAPFLGAEAVLMSARARDKRAAFRVMEALTRDDSAIRRALLARQVVPNRAAYADPRVASDPVLAAFRAQAERAVPMPSSPGMRAVWTPYDQALQRVLGQGEDPAASLARARREIEGFVR